MADFETDKDPQKILFSSEFQPDNSYEKDFCKKTSSNVIKLRWEIFIHENFEKSLCVHFTLIHEIKF